MALGDVTDPEAIVRAIQEAKQDPQAFRAKYGFGPARRYHLRYDGEDYDSKAIVGAAHGYQYPTRGPLRANDFNGGALTVTRLLRKLGFKVVVSGEPVAGSDSLHPVTDPDLFEQQVAEAVLQFEDKGLGAPPQGADVPAQVSATGVRYARSPLVSAWVLAAAAGRCELCDRQAPFDRENGLPYLEAHHVRPMSAHGLDRVENVAACCPNCHRMLHFGADREAERAKLLQRVSRLIDYPASSAIAPK